MSEHAGSRARAPAVLHYVPVWLEPSARFVAGTIEGSRYRPIVVSGGRPVNRAMFPADTLASLAWTHPLPGPWRRRASTLRLLALARRHRVRLLHSHFAYELPLVEAFVRRSGLPWVVSLHGHDLVRARDEIPGRLARILARVDRIVVPSEFLARIAVEAGADRERLAIIASGVDTELFTPSPVPDGHTVVFVGRFVEKKGLDVLAEAWPAVRRQVPDATLRVVGYGPLEQTVSGLPGVEIVRHADHREVRNAISASRVVVTPSRTGRDGDVESLLLVNLEAQASGRPVVTTDHGGVPEYVLRDETALVVPERDAAALAEALVRVLRDDDLARRLGGAGPGWVRRFDARACSARLDEVYGDLVGAIRGGG